MLGEAGGLFYAGQYSRIKPPAFLNPRMLMEKREYNDAQEVSMNRDSYFQFRLNLDERQLIRALANRLQRSQSDAVRYVVINAAKELCSQNADHNETKVQNPNDGD